MRNWHSLYDILIFPIGILFFAFALMGIGNALTNPTFSGLYVIHSELVLVLGEALMKLAGFLVVNFPLLFLVRLTTRKGGNVTTVLAAVVGYIAYVTMTMYFADPSMPAIAFSSILGISTSTGNSSILSTGTHYPIQTGILAPIIISAITLAVFSRTRRRSEYGFFSFISKDVWCVILTTIYSMLAGVLVAYLWPFFMKFVLSATQFIASDTTNPVNLTLFGILDRISNVLNLGVLIRTPFWYGSSGGSWIDIVGNNVAGDVNIWSNQLALSALSGMAGRFITPYYILNLFAVPGLLLGMYSIQTDMVERRRTRLYYILISIISIFGSALLPLELSLVLLSPLLFVFHILYAGLLFGVFQAMNLYLGYAYSGTSTLTAMPGTLLEFLSYFRNLSMRPTLLLMIVVGLITMLVYFLFTRLYFRYLALDLFRTGQKERLVAGTIEAVGGIENVKMTHASTTRLVVSLYDPTKLDIIKLRKLGALRIHETKFGYAISYGGASNIVRLGINECMREAIRISKDSEEA